MPPALKGYYSNGWHLHQSLVDAKTGENRFMPARSGERLSPLGRAFLGSTTADLHGFLERLLGG